ncbi:MAG TPA: hypothetical protein VIV35_02100 [Chitinophagaceae bacterium]
MKKILVFSLLLVLISAAASAQAGPGSLFRKQGIQRGFNQGQFSRSERIELRKDIFRDQLLKRRAGRDGIVTPIERRRLHRAKCDTRRDLFRFRHNNFHRVI